MKKFLLTIIFSLIISFSFSQEKTPKIKLDKAKMKFKTVEAVEHFSKSLKLDAKQKSVFMRTFSEYANNIVKAEHKINDQSKKSSSEKIGPGQKKSLNAYVMRFAQKRDQAVKKCLKGKQAKKYGELIKYLNPITLDFKKKIKKGKK
jgi:hypothetical protein